MIPEIPLAGFTICTYFLGGNLENKQELERAIQDTLSP